MNFTLWATTNLLLSFPRSMSPVKRQNPGSMLDGQSPSPPFPEALFPPPGSRDPYRGDGKTGPRPRSQVPSFASGTTEKLDARIWVIPMSSLKPTLPSQLFSPLRGLPKLYGVFSTYFFEDGPLEDPERPKACCCTKPSPQKRNAAKPSRPHRNEAPALGSSEVKTEKARAAEEGRKRNRASTLISRPRTQRLKPHRKGDGKKTAQQHAKAHIAKERNGRHAGQAARRTGGACGSKGTRRHKSKGRDAAEEKRKQE